MKRRRPGQTSKGDDEEPSQSKIRSRNRPPAPNGASGGKHSTDPGGDRTSTAPRLASPPSGVEHLEEEGQCAICGGRTVVNPSDVLLTALLCEGCECEVHLRCAGKDTIPEEDWFCPDCSKKNAGVPVAVPRDQVSSTPPSSMESIPPSASSTQCGGATGASDFLAVCPPSDVAFTGVDSADSGDGEIAQESEHTVLEDGEKLKFIDEGARARVPSQRQILRLMSDELRKELNETGLIEYLEKLTEFFQNLAGPGTGIGQTFSAVMSHVHEHILQDRRITTRSPEWRVCRDLLGVVNTLWHQPLTSIKVAGVSVKVQEVLLRAPESNVSRLRDLGLPDDDIATSIAAFELLPPGDVRNGGASKLSFKAVLDEKLNLRTVSHSISVGSTLYRGLRLLCSEVNDNWPMQVRGDQCRSRGGGSATTAVARQSAFEDSAGVGTAHPSVGDGTLESGHEDVEIPIERNTARPIVIPTPVPSAAAGALCLSRPMFYGPALASTTTLAPSEANTSRLGGHLARADLGEGGVSATLSGEHAPLVLAPELNSVGGPDMLQPWPVGHTQQRADGRFWSSTDLYMATVDPTFAENVLGVGSGAILPSADPAFDVPGRGSSWLLHEARPSLSAPSTGTDSTACGGFHGYNEKEFTEQWAEGEPFIDHRIISFARSCGVCCNTTIRWAVPKDAEALVAVNKVNARYLDQDYTASMHAKNDFILVAEFMGQVVGFIQYYFQKFTPQASGPRSPRQNPRPILYVATLQTASQKSHPEYCQRCIDTMNTSGNMLADSVSTKSFGAEPRTGVLLMALVLAHGAQDGKELALIDSTTEAVSFYRRFFQMQCSPPALGHKYVPMFLHLSASKGFSIKVLLRPLVQPSLPSEPNQMRLYYRLLPLPSKTANLKHSSTALDLPAPQSAASSGSDSSDPLLGPDGIRYRDFEDARAFVQRLHLFRAQWPAWRDGPDRPKDIPANPDVVYRSPGGLWIDWGDWLGVVLRPSSAAAGRSTPHSVHDGRNGKRSREQLSSFLDNTRPFRVRITLPTSKAIGEARCEYIELDPGDQETVTQVAPMKSATSPLGNGEEFFEGQEGRDASPLDLQLLSSFEPLNGCASGVGALRSASSSGTACQSHKKNTMAQDDDIMQELRRLQNRLEVQEDNSRQLAKDLASKVRTESELVTFDHRTSSLREFKRVLQRYDELVAEEHRNLAALQRRAEEDMDANCAVCSSGEVGPSNQIVFCEYCNVAVHQHCYGVDCIPDGDWFCQPCTAVVPEETRKRVAASTAKEVQAVTCKLCPAKVGAVFPSDDAETWVHTICADVAGLDAAPLVSSDFGVAPSAVRVTAADLERAAARKPIYDACIVCGEATASVALCAWETCRKPLHASCAQSRACNIRCDRTKYNSGAANPSSTSSESSSSTVIRPQYPLRREWTIFCPEHSSPSYSGMVGFGGGRVPSEGLANSAAVAPVSVSASGPAALAANIKMIPGTTVRGPSADGSWFLAGEDKSQRAKELDAFGIRSCHLCRTRKLETVLCSSGRKCRTSYCRQHVERFGEDFQAALNDEHWQCYKCRGICTCSTCSKMKTGLGVSGSLSHGKGQAETVTMESSKLCAGDDKGASGSRTVAASSMFSTNLQKLRFEVDGAQCGVYANSLEVEAENHSSFLFSASSVQAQSSEGVQSLKPPAKAIGHEALAPLEKRPGIVESNAMNQDGARTVLEDMDSTRSSQNPSSKLQPSSVPGQSGSLPLVQ